MMDAARSSETLASSIIPHGIKTGQAIVCPIFLVDALKLGHNCLRLQAPSS